MWNDPTQKSAIFVTFDEDNDNLNYGFGNQGNHVVTVVIPSPGAIAAGMKVGFTSTQYSTQYGLLRTVEEALGLTGQYGYLTSNDQYATPMNDLWGTQGPPSAAASVV